MDAIPDRYDPKASEARWRQCWEDEKVYAQDLRTATFRIDTPPPTLSGDMHIGHGASYTQQDLYARYRRMKDGGVFFPFGTDDNGLPTERLVEKLKKVKATRMPRNEFRALCHATVKELTPDFVRDWKAFGISCDYASSYSTISPACQAVSQRSFIDLFRKGRVYRQEAPVAWCPQCQTAIAQAEFENVEKRSAFNDVRFTTADGEDLTIATTRPELIPACVAIAAHPDDARYAHLKGKDVRVPSCDHTVPVIFDDKVEIGKGTGLMMVCTFGDKDDVDKWYRHKLPLRIIFERDGTCNGLAGKYSGLSILDARAAIIEDLKGDGRLLAQEQITHAANVHERCGTPIEILKTPQWYVRVLDIKEELLERGRQIKWHPEHMRVRYEHWVENLNWDWCVSRQRYFGVPFPVWYDTRDGTVYVADPGQLPVDPFVDKPASAPAEALSHLIPEEDVMDTWATSSVTPQIVTGWHDDPDGAQLRMPLSLRPQAHEIIRTWTFYTIVKAHLNNDTIPWTDIALSGYVTDPKGQKMSKSKGNVVEPRSVIAKYSADAARYWAAGVRLGEDFPYNEKELQAGTKLLTKLWNASRFVMMNLKGYDGFDARFEDLELMDRWLLAKYARLVRECTEAFEAYEHHAARRALDAFFWSDLCDNYLEIVKGRLYEPKDALQRSSAQYALSIVLEGVLKLYAPFIPFITEEVYHLLRIKNKAKSIHISQWPDASAAWEDKDALVVGEEIVRIVVAVRKHKADRRLSMAAPVAKLTVATNHDLTLAENDLLSATRARGFTHARGDFDVRIE